MRDILKPLENEEITVKAYFHRFGYKRNNSLSVLVEKVSFNDILLTEHTWIEYSEEFKNIEINSGDQISFTATVVQYTKKEGTDYGFANIKNIKVLSHCGKSTDLNTIKYFKFTIPEQQTVWKEIKGEKRTFVHNSELEIQEDVTIKAGDIIEIELHKIKNTGYMEYVWRIERHDRWNKGAFFNPISYGQALVVYGFYQIYLPEDIFFAIKDFYFKLMFSKTNIELPYTHEHEHYVKPDKFKNRKFLNYNSSGEKLDDKSIKVRTSIFKELPYYISLMSEEELINISKIFENVTYIDVYNNEHSKNYKNKKFLNEKVMNTFNSSNITTKCEFLDAFIAKVLELELYKEE